MKKLIAILISTLSVSVVAHADTFTVDGPCNARFSPKGGAEDMLVKYIGAAKSSVKVLAYSFTSRPIAEALSAAQKRGVHVRVILDKSQLTAKGSQLGFLATSGVSVWVDSKHAIAHNKTIIIDDKYYENGSFNFTNSAENSNGENAVICPSVSGAAVFSADFNKHLSHSEAQ